jgi:hypothetical protein
MALVGLPSSHITPDCRENREQPCLRYQIAQLARRMAMLPDYSYDNRFFCEPLLVGKTTSIQQRKCFLQINTNPHSLDLLSAQFRIFPIPLAMG